MFLGVLGVANSALGGATQPESPHSRLEEVAPLIESVEIIPSKPYLEVFVTGTGHLDCFNVREFIVEKTEEATLIIPRLRRSDPNSPCRLGLSSFRDKAADLDPSVASSKKIRVLGFRGWSETVVP